MRKEKFNAPADPYNGDDINYAFEYNSLADRLENIDVIVAEVCGENDGNNWYWILQMKNGTFSTAQGGCDYTGWDCQSHAEIKDGYKTPEEAISALEVSEYDTRKPELVIDCLRKQITEELPFAIFTEPNVQN